MEAVTLTCPSPSSSELSDLQVLPVDPPAAAPVAMLRGVVEHGDERGRELGFPTANLSIETAVGGVELEDGVWAGWLYRADGTQLPAAISIGGRPTFYGRKGFRLVEAHVLDFSGDLYDEVVEVAVCHKIRRQQRFRSLDALVVQLDRDIEETCRWAIAQGMGRNPLLSVSRE
jgi:riboflavin kinase/FMN adenylyltransferase